MLNAHHDIAEESSSTNLNGVAHAAGRPVDLVHLSHHTLGNRDLEREILRLFVKQSDIYFMRLSAASSVSEWHQASHTIKGSARGIGAWGVVKCAQKAERLKSLKAVKQRAKMADALEAAIGEANHFIKSVLSDN